MASLRLSRVCRMRDAATYGRVFAKAKRSKDGLFTVLYRKNGEQHGRLGLAVSKKNCRLACRRNRIKRIIRESFRHHQASLVGIDIVVLNQSATSQADNRLLRQSLEAHWRRCCANEPV